MDIFAWEHYIHVPSVFKARKKYNNVTRGVVEIALSVAECCMRLHHNYYHRVQHVPFRALIDLLYLASYRPYFPV